ncbi:MAG: ester cyclase [Anaerolineae bacterium]
MLIEPNRTLVRRAVDEFYNPGNLAAADNLFAPNYVNHDPNAPEARTLEGLKALHAARIAAFPDQKVTIEAMFAEGDMVAKRWSWHGTHLGEFFGVPPSGKAVSLEGVTLYRIAGGKIAECWWGYNTLGLLQQIGAIPMPQGASA